MITFWIVLFVTMFITVIAEMVGQKSPSKLNLTSENNYKIRAHKQTNKMLFMVAMIVLILMAGLRSSI